MASAAPEGIPGCLLPSFVSPVLVLRSSVGAPPSHSSTWRRDAAFRLAFSRSV